MSNVIDQLALDTLRNDFDNLLGIFDYGGGTDDTDAAKTTVTITRITDRGTLNATTKLYDDPTISTIYTGPADISPVTYRRDRQEIGGMESIRIRQYRSEVPWDAGDIWIDDVMTVNTCQDVQMVGKAFTISDVLYESEEAVRRLSLTDTSKDGEGADC